VARHVRAAAAASSPADESAPAIFSEWRVVAEWDEAKPTAVLGYRDSLVWLSEEGHVISAVDADGKRTYV